MNRKFPKYICSKCGGKKHSKKEKCPGCKAKSAPQKRARKKAPAKKTK